MFPVEVKLGEIAAHLRRGRDVVLTAPPGSGKTTCVPPALLDEPWLKDKKILMLEPRRIAARGAATYIARKCGEAVGGTIGYQVRLERKVSSATRLEVLTEGLLTARIMEDPELKDVGLIIFDEFHERSLNCDTAFALALEVKRALREDLRLMVMSATLDADAVATFLGAEIVHAEGRMFPVETVYLGDLPLSAAIDRALKETDGDVLCFLPGEGEIKRNLNSGYLPLYGSLPKEEQDRVFASSTERKVILATSIAETSITLEGITAVVDSGLMRVPKFSPATGMSGLKTLPLTLDRAEQRRGRAGRVKPGVCYRLWTEAEEGSRPKKMLPEILDADLAPTVLTAFAWGATKREDLPWMTPPPAAAWEQAVELLTRLGAIKDGILTEKGKRMASLPMHPRLANMLIEGGDPMLAAIIEEGARGPETDIRYIRPTPRMRELARRFASHSHSTSSLYSLHSSLSLAYPDRIARNRGNATFQMVSGRGAFLPPEDPLAKEPFLVAAELDDRPGDAKIFLAAPITLKEIEAYFGEQISETPYCEWDRAAERVKAVIRRQLGAMTIAERNPRSEEYAALPVEEAMLEGIRQKGVENLPGWTKELLQYKSRIEFMFKHCGKSFLLEPRVFLPFLSGFTKWKDLEKLDLKAVLDSVLADNGFDRRQLDRFAPARMEVPSGSHMVIHYEGDEPTVAVKLQECFGLMETPKVADGKVPIVMTLLSPAQRPIQITKDLAGFWRGAYQLVRKDMKGRYPKHFWPEDPLSATASRSSIQRHSKA